MIKLEDVKEEIVARAQDLIDGLFSAHQQIVNYYSSHSCCIPFMPLGDSRVSLWVLDVYDVYFSRAFKLIASIKKCVIGNVFCEAFIINHAKDMLELVLIEIRSIFFRILEDRSALPIVDDRDEKCFNAMLAQKREAEDLKEFILKITPEIPPIKEGCKIGTYHA